MLIFHSYVKLPGCRQNIEVSWEIQHVSWEKLWKVTRKHSHIDGLHVIVHIPAHKWNINGTYGLQIYSMIDEL